MIDVILFISIIFIIALGYYVMCCVDNFICSGEDIEKQIEYKDKDVLLYKCSYKIYSLLDSRNVSYDIVDYPALPALNHYRIVLALSENDLDNLLLCSSAKHANPYSRTIARCNSQIYREIFMREDVDAVIFDQDQEIAILNEWKVII